uniref:Uncharacterized protein n=1 Tax=Sinocyclocheilus grahami TaxID=75366 RepID=A0A672M2E4_SINGR
MVKGLLCFASCLRNYLPMTKSKLTLSPRSPLLPVGPCGKMQNTDISLKYCTSEGLFIKFAPTSFIKMKRTCGPGKPSKPGWPSFP